MYHPIAPLGQQTLTQQTHSPPVKYSCCFHLYDFYLFWNILSLFYSDFISAYYIYSNFSEFSCLLYNPASCPFMSHLSPTIWSNLFSGISVNNKFIQYENFIFIMTDMTLPDSQSSRSDRPSQHINKLSGHINKPLQQLVCKATCPDSWCSTRRGWQSIRTLLWGWSTDR